MAEHLVLFGEMSNPLEASYECQANETLRIHMFAKIQVLAEVVNGEVILTVSNQQNRSSDARLQYLQLHLNQSEDGVLLHIRLVWDGAHWARRNRLKALIYSVDLR